MTGDVGLLPDGDDAAWGRLDERVASMIRQADHEAAAAQERGAVLRSYRASLAGMRKIGVPIALLEARAAEDGSGETENAAGSWVNEELLAAGEAQVNAVLEEVGDRPISDVTAATREVKSRTSTAKVVTGVVDDLGAPVTSQQLVREVTDRGLADPDWKTPTATITQAARRAVKQKMLQRLADGRFATINFQDSAVSSEARASEAPSTEGA